MFWLIALSTMVKRGYGRSLLTSDHLVFRTLVSRRPIPWVEIAQIEKRRHQSRSFEWWDVRVVRVSGRSLTVPGTFTSKRYDAALEQKLALIREYWSRSTSR